MLVSKSSNGFRFQANSVRITMLGWDPIARVCSSHAAIPYFALILIILNNFDIFWRGTRLAPTVLSTSVRSQWDRSTSERNQGTEEDPQNRQLSPGIPGQSTKAMSELDFMNTTCKQVCNGTQYSCNSILEYTYEYTRHIDIYIMCI